MLNISHIYIGRKCEQLFWRMDGYIKAHTETDTSRLLTSLARHKVFPGQAGHAWAGLNHWPDHIWFVWHKSSHLVGHACPVIARYWAVSTSSVCCCCLHCPSCAMLYIWHTCVLCEDCQSVTPCDIFSKSDLKCCTGLNKLYHVRGDRGW